MTRSTGSSCVGRWAALGLLLAVLAGSGAAQSGRKPPSGAPQTPGTSEGDDTGEVTLRTQEVLLSVTVRDTAGRPAAGLTPEDFIVAEDGKRQKIESFSKARIPV